MVKQQYKQQLYAVFKRARVLRKYFLAEYW